MNAAALAHQAVGKAVKNGTLPRLDGSVLCVDCGNSAKMYEHRDYSKPLDVSPVCQGCNQRRGEASNHPRHSADKKSRRIGSVIKNCRQVLGIDQKTFASLAGMSHGLLSQIESGTVGAATSNSYNPLIVGTLRKQIAKKMAELGSALEEIALATEPWSWL